MNFTYNLIQRRWAIACLFIIISVFGYYSWTNISIEAYPDIADVTSQVVTQVNGLAAEEVETQITIPLERVLNGLPGMHIMRSKSTFGLSIITLVFKDGIDDYWARMRIQERLNDVDLPYDATPELDPLTSPVGEVYRYIIESKTHSLRELTDLQNFTIIPRIKQVPGVADVTNFGGITTQYQIELEPHKLDQYSLTLKDVIETVQNNNQNAGGSILPQGELDYVVRGIGMVRDLEDIGRIVVKSESGKAILLSDLGKLKYGNLERKGILGYTDRDREYTDGIQGIVLLLKGQNPSESLIEIKEAVNELNQHILPSDVHIHAFLDRTDLVDSTLQTVSRTLLEGMILVIVVLILFLGNWRGALLVAITIPLSLLIAFILMKTTNIPANLLSLGAIDFGIIVDGAIVMVEAIIRKREDKPNEVFLPKSLAETAAKVARPIFFATVIIITAYIPLFAFERVEKKLFTPMAFTVGYALLGALIVALILIPGIAYMIYKKPTKIYHNKWLDKLSRCYKKLIHKSLKQPKNVLLPIGVITLLTVALSINIGKDFLPEMDEGSIWLQVELPPGISLQKSKELSDTLRARTIKYEEVEYVMVQAGRNDDGTDPWTASHFEVSVGLKPYNIWPRGKVKADLINELATEYNTLPGFSVGFSQPMIDGVMDKISGAHSELVIKVYGEDFDEMRRISEEIMVSLESVRGAVDLAIDQEPPLPQLQIHANRDKIAQYGLNVSEVTELIEVALGGKAISQIFVHDKVYDIVCRYKESVRNTVDKLANLHITNIHGHKIPLSQIADIQLSTGESTITREMNKRHMTIKLNVRDRDLSSLLKEAKEKIAKDVHYDEHHYELKWGGQFENQHRAYSRLAVVIPMTLSIIFLLLYIAFGKFRHAGLLMMIVPLAIFGGMLALTVRGMTLNVSSAVGFIALFGVSIQNGIIMISHINDLVQQGLPLQKAIIQGAEHRFRPVLMTATVAILGLLPASLSTGIGSDIQRPLATVIVYGLLFSTVLTLYVLPSIYYMIEKKWGVNKHNN